ncbi:peptidase M23 [Streptomyces sp. NPDC050204]|uniref:peptidase M23 n=1 Tax=Streptomyces sp. NPDC050204 TaxID=3155514 RepID=UPI0034426514
MNERDVTQIALQAAGVARKGLALKYGIVLGVFFLIGLLLLGALSPTQSANASSCEDTGPGTDSAAPDTSGSPPASGTVRKQQLANAKTIDRVARKLDLPGRATLIALMTAMQESTLQNLDHGHLDSIGLFQQRPSQDWGSRKQIMNPEYASESFFKGRGTNKGLVDIANWKTRPLGEVAQAVQGSAYPHLYAGHETAVRKLAKEASLDLTRSSSATNPADNNEDPASPADDNEGDAPAGTPASRCGSSEPDSGKDTPSSGGKGGTFTDGEATWQLRNPRSVKEAIAWAQEHSGIHSTNDWYQRCLAFVAIVYGWNFSGVNYAIDHYKVVPADMRHDGDRHPPPGALMYWDTGHRAGHIAVYLGDGLVASNDISRPGYVDIVKADAFEHKWRAKYVGWTPPVFPRAG